MVVSIDPGTDLCGIALWTDEGVLSRAWLARSKAKKHDDLPTRWRGTVRAVGTGRVSALVVEGQQIYSHSKGDNNDLLQLASVIGGLAQTFDAPLVRYLPREWNRGAKEEVVRVWITRSLHTWELDRMELKPAYLAHNVWDAVGIGLHFFKRLCTKGGK